MQGTVPSVAQAHLECAPGRSLWTRMRPLSEEEFVTFGRLGIKS